MKSSIGLINLISVSRTDTNYYNFKSLSEYLSSNNKLNFSEMHLVTQVNLMLMPVKKPNMNA